MIEVRPITVDYLRKHGSALIAEYAAECGRLGQRKPNPQWEIYEMMQASGFYRMQGVFSGTEIVGFAGYFIATSAHYGIRTMTVESLFVAAEHRTEVGAALLVKLQSIAFREDCEETLFTAPAGGVLEAMLERRGSYFKRIGSIWADCTSNPQTPRG